MKIKNKDLAHVINFLDGLSIKGLKSIYRTNISNQLKAKLEVLVQNQQQLQDELKDEPLKFQTEINKLLNGYVTIDDTDSRVQIESLKSVIKPLVAEDSNHEFKDGDAIGVAALYEALNLGGDE